MFLAIQAILGFYNDPSNGAYKRHGQKAQPHYTEKWVIPAAQICIPSTSEGKGNLKSLGYAQGLAGLAKQAVNRN